MPSILSRQDARDLFLEDSFAIDCREIRLTQNGTETPKKISCSGSLNVSANEGVTARLVFIQSGDHVESELEALKRASEIKSGQLFPDDRYYTLLAIEPNGEEWTCSDVDVKIKQLRDHAIVELSCSWIRCQTMAEGERDSVHMLLPSEIAFPKNSFESFDIKRDGLKTSGSRPIGSQGKVTGANIRYRVADHPKKCFEFIADPIDGRLPPAFANKLIEAIRFATASSISFYVCESVRSGVRILEIAKTTPLKKGMYPEPLLARRHHVEDFYRLFDCYLQYAIADAPGEEFAFISKAMHPLYNLDGVSLDAIALLVSVTVESVIQHQFVELGKPKQSVLDELGLIKAAIAALDIEKSTKVRARDSLDGWNSSRATDKMHELLTAKKITEDDIKNWKKLRNTSAHGGLHGKANDLQKLLNRVYKVSAFLNRLVFLAIGYNGKFTDYSKLDWPDENFGTPPPVAGSPAASTGSPNPSGSESARAESSGLIRKILACLSTPPLDRLRGIFEALTKKAPH